MSLITSFYSIATKSYRYESAKTYDQIPENEERFFDLILRNLSYTKNGAKIIVDLGINRNEINYNDAKEFYYSSSVEDMGDLSVFHGFEDFDLSGYELFHGKTYPKEFGSLNEIEKLDFMKLYKEGYTSVILKSKNSGKPFTDLPINIKQKNNVNISSNQKLLGSKANFIIMKNGKVQYAIVNGYMIGVKSPYGKVLNALIR